MSIKTRNLVNCPLFGAPKEMSCVVLPTYECIMKEFLWTRIGLEEKSVNRNLLVSKTSEIIAKRVEDIWKTASIPVVSHQRIVELVKQYHVKCQNLLKPYKQRQNVASYKLKLEAFKADSKRLFDIASCKCTDFSSCLCAKHYKIPVMERAFVLDQRKSRKMIIVGVDRQELQRQQKRDSRTFTGKIVAETVTSKSLSTTSEKKSIPDRNNDGGMDLDLNKPSTSEASSYSNPRNLASLPVLAKTLDRYGVSDRAGAAIASAVLKDYGIIKTDDHQNVIDRYKVRRARDNERQNLQKNITETVVLRGLYFDGRMDKTLTFSEKRKRIIVEEHVVLIQEPESKYLGHVSPPSGSAQNILQSMLHYLQSSSISTDLLQAVGCDGTNCNTGHKAGIITLLENSLQRPLQWIICQFHANELPLRHLVQHLDGRTTGPRGFQGPIGKALGNCENLPFVNFERIDSSLPDMPTGDLSSDQKYMYDICQVIMSGTWTNSMAKRDPGKLNHSRWLTTGNRILRLYAATENPSASLVILATFIMKVYAPMWLKIKLHSSCIYGPKHIFETIRLSSYLPEDLKNIVQSVIQRNGYFGHPENILLAMLWDERSYIRKLAYHRILKVRSNPNNSIHTNSVRSFIIPQFNFNCEDYIELIDWQNIVYNEPPITRNLAEDQLKQVVENPNSSPISYARGLPCHTQAVERAVKLLTQASNSVCDKKRRDGFIRNTLDSRAKMPKFETKKDFSH